MATIHCLQDACTDSATCPCPCEDCFFAKRDESLQPNNTTYVKPKGSKKMSALIGRLVGPNHNTAAADEDGNTELSHVAEVWCSRAGVEVHTSLRNDQALSPIVARNFAALLVRAADEVERMRRNPSEEERFPDCTNCGHPFAQHWMGHAPCAHACLDSCRVGDFTGRSDEEDRHTPDCCKCPCYAAADAPVPPFGIQSTLDQLARTAWRDRLDPKVRTMAKEVTESWPVHHDKVNALVDAMHYRNPTVVDPHVSLDADDACVFVAAAAMSIGIPCRFVAARFGNSWTCWLSVQVGPDRWEIIDPMRRKPMDPDEKVMGPMPEMP